MCAIIYDNKSAMNLKIVWEKLFLCFNSKANNLIMDIILSQIKLILCIFIIDISKIFAKLKLIFDKIFIFILFWKLILILFSFILSSIVFSEGFITLFANGFLTVNLPKLLFLLFSLSILIEMSSFLLLNLRLSSLFFLLISFVWFLFSFLYNKIFFSISSYKAWITFIKVSLS